MRLMRPVMPANLLGLPAAAVPAGKAAGLPVGVQVMGGRFQELACLEAAEAIESALGVAEAIDPVLEVCRRQLSEHMFVLRWRGKPRRSDNANDHDRRSGRGRHRLGHPDRRRSADVQSSVQVPLAGHLTVASQMRAEHTELAQQRLTRKAWRSPTGVADARDRGFSPRAYRRRVNDEPPATLARRVRDAAPRAQAARSAEPRAAPRDASASPTLEAIAACESGGNPGTDTGNGFYGKYQFTLADVAERRRHRQPGGRQRGRAEPPRGDALRARGRLALAGLRPLGSRTHGLP